MNITLEFKPRKGFKNLIRHLDKVNGASAEWGIYRTSGIHPEAKIPVAQLMAIHELRNDKWRRPVFRISAIRYQDEHLMTTAKGMSRFINVAASGRQVSINTALKKTAQLGAKRATKIFGDRSILVPNTARTKAIKGHDHPLIDLGVLKKSVKFKVNKKGER